MSNNEIEVPYLLTAPDLEYHKSRRSVPGTIKKTRLPTDRKYKRRVKKIKNYPDYEKINAEKRQEISSLRLQINKLHKQIHIVFGLHIELINSNKKIETASLQLHIDELSAPIHEHESNIIFAPSLLPFEIDDELKTELNTILNEYCLGETDL